MGINKLAPLMAKPWISHWLTKISSSPKYPHYEWVFMVVGYNKISIGRKVCLSNLNTKYSNPFKIY
jgi:hypothetical protein